MYSIFPSLAKICPDLCGYTPYKNACNEMNAFIGVSVYFCDTILPITSKSKQKFYLKIFNTVLLKGNN